MNFDQFNDQSGEQRLATRKHLRPESDPDRVVLPATMCPPIVSSAVWDAVQERLQRNKLEALRNTRDPEAALLRAGYAFCGYCGHKMSVYRSSRSRSGRPYYVCQLARSQVPTRQCPGGQHTISTKVLDDAVWLTVVYTFQHPERVRLLLNSKIGSRDQEQARLGERRKAIRGRLEQVETYISNAARAALAAPNADMRAVWEAQTEQLVAERKGLQREVREIEESIDRYQHATTYLRTIEEWCQLMGPVLGEATFEERRFLMHGLGVRVVCYRQGHTPRYEITWNVAGLRPELQALDLPTFTDADVSRLSAIVSYRTGSSGR